MFNQSSVVSRFGKLAAVWVACLAAALGSAAGLEAQVCLGDPESFRFDLALYVTDFENLALAIEAIDDHRGEILRRAADELEYHVERLPDDGLTQLCEMFSRYPEFRQAPGMLSEALAEHPAQEGSGGCMSREAHVNLLIAHFVLKAAEAIAKGLCASAKCPLYAGVAICVPAPPSCVFVCPVVLGGLREALIVSEAVRDDDKACRSGSHGEVIEALIADTGMRLDSIGSQLESTVLLLDEALSTRATEESLGALEVLASAGFGETVASLAQLLADLEAQADERTVLERLDRQLAIEEALQAGRSGLISTLALPEALGGVLELVREIVADVIGMNASIGEVVDEALARFAAADAAFNSGDYLSAYRGYRVAYQAAARPNPPPGGGKGGT